MIVNEQDRIFNKIEQDITKHQVAIARLLEQREFLKSINPAAFAAARDLIREHYDDH